MPRKAVNRLLRKFGITANIYFSRICSCVRENNGSADPLCTICSHGFIYTVEPEKTILIRTAVNLRAMHEKFALLYEGGANITIPKYDLQKNPVKAYEMVAMNDVITIPSDTQRDRDLCELGVKDYLLTFDVKEVLSITSREVEIFINDDGEADKKFVERYYFPNVDYVVELQHTNTKIVWLDKGKKPSRFYSVEYKCFPNYIVWDDMTKNRGGEFSDLPKEVRCRLRTYDDPNKPNIAKMKIEYPQAMPSEEGEQQVEEN